MLMFENFLRKHLSGRAIQCLACFTATIACLDDGLLNVWPAPALPKLIAEDSEIPTSTEAESWIASLALISLAIGSIFTIQGVRIIGNKNVILLSCIPAFLSWMLVVFATTTIELYISRFIAGFCDAMCYVAVPAYIGEIAEPALRGVLSSLMMVSFNFGVIVTYYYGYVLPLKQFPMIVGPIPVILFLVFIFMPQSPSYLISRGRIDCAKQQLEMIRDNDISKEFEEIKQTVQVEATSFLDLCRVTVNRKAMFMILLTVFIWQCSGIVVMTLYLHSIVLEARIDVPEVIPITMYALVQFLSGIGTIFIVDRQGRKPLLYTSCIGTAVSLFMMGFYFFVKEMHFSTDNIRWLPVMGLIAYIFFASIGLGIIPVVYTSELFAYNMQSYGGAILCISFGVFGLGANSVFQLLSESVGMYIVFWIFAFLTMVGALVVYIFLPETKNKSRTEIQEMLTNTNFFGKSKKSKEVTKC